MYVHTRIYKFFLPFVPKTLATYRTLTTAAQRAHWLSLPQLDEQNSVARPPTHTPTGTLIKGEQTEERPTCRKKCQAYAINQNA